MIQKILLTKVSVLRLKENMKEHRTRQTLINIPLRSMLINVWRATKKKTCNRIKAKGRLTLRPRLLANRQPLTLICKSFIRLT